MLCVASDCGVVFVVAVKRNFFCENIFLTVHKCFRFYCIDLIRKLSSDQEDKKNT